MPLTSVGSSATLTNAGSCIMTSRRVALIRDSDTAATREAAKEQPAFLRAEADFNDQT
jgi:hypothetical protein